MVICHALNCQSNSKDKIRLFQFPRDKDRQLVWLQNCGKNNFRPTSKLCELHFDEKQFEQQRADGWRKLKQNAVPTIFSHLQDASEDSSGPGNNSPTNNSTDSVQDDPETMDISSSPEVQTSLEVSSFPANKQSTGNINLLDFIPSNLEDENRRLKSIISRLNTTNKTLKKEVSVGKKKYNQLRKKFKHTHSQYTTLLNKITKIPIIKYFAREMKNPRGQWSPESLKFATQIRYAVGWKAYIYLRKELGLPLPSYSTITRNTNQLDFKPGILHDMVTLMEAKKKSHESSLEADCVVLIDEMDIQPSLEYDISAGFNKMNVAAAAHIFSLKTAAALETLISLKIIEEDALTTVWFLEEANSWFNTMNARHPNDAIGTVNFTKSMKVIDNFLSIIENILIGRAWKPVQTGIKTSCINIMNLTKNLFKAGYKFFLTTRVNQDALENLFSILRRYSVHPTALQTKRCLRLISVSQLTDINTSKKNYDDDDDNHYVDFFESLKVAKKSIRPTVIIPIKKSMRSPIYDDEQNYEHLKPVENIVECNIINNVLGSAISFVLRKKYVCNSCATALTSENNGRCSIYTKALSIGFLENPSNIFLQYITMVEAHIKEHLDRCIKHPQLYYHLLEMIKLWVPIEKYGISRDCAIETGESCFLVENVVNRYIYIRLILYVKEKSKRKKESRFKSFASKSAQRQSIV